MMSQSFTAEHRFNSRRYGPLNDVDLATMPEPVIPIDLTGGLRFERSSCLGRRTDIPLALTLWNVV